MPKKWHLVRLISIAVADRASAWNTLLESATTSTAIFVDADVLLAPDTLERIASTFRIEPDLAIASAVSVLTVISGITRLYQGPARPEFGGYVTGGCHGMPCNLIADYRWLRWIAGPAGARSVSATDVYQKAPYGADLLAIARYSVRGNLQLPVLVPEFSRNGHTGKSAGIPFRLLKMYRDSTSLFGFVCSLISGAVRLGVREIATMQVRFVPAGTRFSTWDVARSTKAEHHFTGSSVQSAQAVCAPEGDR